MSFSSQINSDFFSNKENFKFKHDIEHLGNDHKIFK